MVEKQCLEQVVFCSLLCLCCAAGWEQPSARRAAANLTLPGHVERGCGMEPAPGDKGMLESVQRLPKLIQHCDLCTTLHANQDTCASHSVFSSFA